MLGARERMEEVLQIFIQLNKCKKSVMLVNYNLVHVHIKRTTIIANKLTIFVCSHPNEKF